MDKRLQPTTVKERMEIKEYFRKWRLSLRSEYNNAMFNLYNNEDLL